MEIPRGNIADAREKTLAAVKAKAPIIYQAALESGQFAGFADFIILDAADQFQVWDTKLARSPKPYYAIQLCCYSEMFAAATGRAMPEKFGIILGTKNRRPSFGSKILFTITATSRIDSLLCRPDLRETWMIVRNPFPGPIMAVGLRSREEFFEERDDLARVAGISQAIKKLNAAGITTVAELAAASGRSVRKLAADSLEKLVAQARLQSQTIADRLRTPTCGYDTRSWPRRMITNPSVSQPCRRITRPMCSSIWKDIR